MTLNNDVNPKKQISYTSCMTMVGTKQREWRYICGFELFFTSIETNKHININI